MRGHGREQEMLLLVAHIEWNDEALDAHVLLVQTHDVARELRHHLATLLDRLDLRERLPRHDAAHLREDLRGVIGRARQSRRRHGVVEGEHGQRCGEDRGADDGSKADNHCNQPLAKVAATSRRYARQAGSNAAIIPPASASVTTPSSLGRSVDAPVASDAAAGSHAPIAASSACPRATPRSAPAADSSKLSRSSTPHTRPRLAPKVRMMARSY